MNTEWPECSATENHAWLLGEFADLLCGFEPAGVLDVGCGAGRLMEILRERGVEVAGLDQPGPRLEALVEAGFEVREGSAYALPFEDRSVDWVTLRHVPHHLQDPGRAFAEALRVAGRGLLMAEPSFDGSLPCQRAALALDRWEKRQHRRRGMFHAEALQLGELRALLPRGFEESFELEAHSLLRPRGRSLEGFAAEAQELVADLADEHPERVALSELLAELAQTGLSWNGSLSVVVRRR